MGVKFLSRNTKAQVQLGTVSYPHKIKENNVNIYIKERPNLEVKTWKIFEKAGWSQM